MNFDELLSGANMSRYLLAVSTVIIINMLKTRDF